ncbi:MAG: amidohydrolase family protein, partial [Chloroflexi bacterium]|nr:amidohydrolase family protein [Chloroflexota bacterium]
AAVFRMATEGGGRVLGIPGLGTLAPGAPADLLVVGTDGGTPITAQNVLEQLVMYRGPAHLRAVVVNGELVWHQGTSLGLNEAEVWRWFREAAAEFWRTTPS